VEKESTKNNALEDIAILDYLFNPRYQAAFLAGLFAASSLTQLPTLSYMICIVAFPILSASIVNGIIEEVKRN